MAIKGITYSNQRVSAADHASLFSMLIKDGVITGCAMTHSLNKCIIGSGAFIVAGRLTNIIGTETIEFASGHAGFARIVGVININNTATKTEFEQFGFRVDYATSSDVGTETGFPELTQDNVNDRGILYEIEWAVVPIDSQGIVTGDPVRYIAPSEAQEGGGGGGGSISGNSFTFTPDDPSYVGENAIIFIEDPNDSSNWEIVFLTSGTFKFKVNPGAIDIFAVSAGVPGETGRWTGSTCKGGNGGRGGTVLTAYSGTPVSKGSEYIIKVGGSRTDAGADTEAFGIIAACPVPDSGYGGGGGGAQSAQSSGQATSNAGSGVPGVRAFYVQGSETLTGSLFDSVKHSSDAPWLYGSDGGGGGAYGNSGGNKSPAVGASTYYGQSGSSAYGGGGATTGDRTGHAGREHTGQGGGGGGYQYDQYGGLGASGGSGIVIIRNHRTAESA